MRGAVVKAVLTALAVSGLTLPPLHAQREWTAERLPFAVSDGDADELASPRTLAVLRDGSVAIVESADQQVHIVSATGKPIRVLGRKGKGPGEFVDANGLLALPDGGLLVVDERSSRITRYGADGTLQGSLPTFTRSYSGIWSGTLLQDGRVATLEYDAPAPGEQEPRLLLAFLDLKTGTYTSRPFPACALAPKSDLLRFGDEKRFMNMLVPFSPGPMRYVDPSGGIWCGGTGKYLLVRSPIEGAGPTRTIRSDAAPVPVPADERAATIARVKESAKKQGFVFTDDGRVPRVRPFFEAITMDDRGRLWVMRPEKSSVTFDIFDKGERPVARLRLPVRMFAYDTRIIKDGILTTFTYDEDDVKSVVRFRVAARK